MKVIFLDIDEVLCGLFSALTNDSKIPHLNMKDLSKNNFNLESLRLIKKLIKLSDAKLVLSSIWRLNIDSVYDKLRLEKVLGFNIFDMTIRCPTGFRGNEVEEYIVNNNVHKYVIIDDSTDFLEHQYKNHVRVKGYRGFIMDDFLKACDILEIEDKKVEAIKSFKKFLKDQK